MSIGFCFCLCRFGYFTRKILPHADNSHSGMLNVKVNMCNDWKPNLRAFISLKVISFDWRQDNMHCVFHLPTSSNVIYLYTRKIEAYSLKGKRGNRYVRSLSRMISCFCINFSSDSYFLNQ